MVLWVGRQCMIAVILTFFLDVCGDTELTSGMRLDFYSVMPDHKEASSTADLKAVRGVYWSDLCNI